MQITEQSEKEYDYITLDNFSNLFQMEKIEI